MSILSVFSYVFYLIKKLYIIINNSIYYKFNLIKKNRRYKVNNKD